jgi:RHS repeat-associated protein
MYPLYTCDYGAGNNWNPPQNLGGVKGGIVPFTCKIGNSTGTELIPVKNLGGQGYQLGCDRDNPYISNPIHAAIGNKYTSENDYTSQFLTFTRYYNSQQNNLNRGAGIKWRNNYNRKLVFIQNGTEFATFTERADGQVLFFSQDVNGNWVGDDDSNIHLHEVIDSNNNTIGWQLTNTDDTVETYGTVGNLLSIIGHDGRTQILTYDINNWLITVTDDIGRELNFTYDGSGRIVTLTDPAGGVFTYGYDTNSNLVSVTYPDNKTRTYHYNESAYTSGANLPHALTGITDENGVRYAIYTYDTSGRAIVTEHAGGADRHALNYVSGSSTVVTDPLGSQYAYNFQTILGVAKSVGQSQPAGSGCSTASSATTYDVNGNVASRADFNGNKTCYAYDLSRNLEIARVEGLSSGSNCPADVVNHIPASGTSQRKILTGWHTNFRLPVQVIENGRETTITYDTYGNVTQLSIRDSASNETRTWSSSYTYHATVPGVIVQRVEDGPRTDVSDTTTIDYYAPDAACTGGHFGCRGQVMRITNALGHITDITRYNAHGQVEQIVDANNLTTTLTYDSRQRLVSRVVGSETITYQYDNAGQLIQLTRPDGSSLYYTYDDAHRLTDITDSLGNTIRYTLDAAGNRTKEEIFDASNTLAQSRQQEFDALSRLWKMTGAQNQITELAYDANGNLKQTIDPLLHTATRQFDALDRLIQITDPMSGQTLQTHDALDQITQVTDPKGVATSYTTNVFGDVTQEISQDRGTTTYTYDLAGNQLTKTDARGMVQTTAYDALNRPISQSYSTVSGIPQTGTVTWTYDTGTNGIGRLTGMSDESGSTSYQYDQYGRLIQKTQTVSHNSENFVQTLSYQYNANGQLTRMTYPSGTQIDYVYGADGRPVELKINGNILIKNVVYRPFGEPESWNWGNGHPYSRGFDLDGRLTQHPLGADIQTLTYDAASRIVNTTHTNPIYNRTYEYDANDRLIRQTDTTTTKLWGYDANSNRTSEQSGATVYPYTIDTNSNRLLSVAGPVAKTYTYDAAGNPLGDGARTFTWNAAGRLTQITISGSDTLHQYNGSGERVNKGLSGASHTFFLFDPAARLIGDYLENQSTQQTGDWLLGQETVWFGNIPVAVIKQVSPTDPIQVYMIHTDHLNTPRVIVDSTNTPVWLWRNQNAFGDNSPNEDPDGDSNLFTYNLRFAGQYFDTETGLHYNFFRDYEPATGRYLSSDPIGLAGGLNTYGYVSGNPLWFVDPDGLNPRLIYEVIIKSANKTKKIWDDLNFDGPSPGLQHGNGRVCQVRYKKKPVIRLDYQPYPGTKGESRLHLDFDSLGIKHVPLDPRRLFDE